MQALILTQKIFKFNAILPHPREGLVGFGLVFFFWWKEDLTIRFENLYEIEPS